MVDKLDESVGTIVKELGMRKLLNNSIIIFASDNGGAPEGIKITFYISWKNLRNNIAYTHKYLLRYYLHKLTKSVSIFIPPLILTFVNTPFYKDNNLKRSCGSDVIWIFDNIVTFSHSSESEF